MNSWESPGWAADPALMLRFAGERFEDRDFARALGEYQRLRKEFPSFEPHTVRFRLGRAFLAAGVPEEALAEWEGIPTEEARRAIGELYLSLKKPELAVLHYERLGAKWDVPRAFALVQAGRDEEAARLLERELPAGAEILRHPLAERSPFFYASLSLIAPGLGQLALGRRGDALSAFLIAAGLDGAGLYYLQKSNPAWGAFYLVLGGIFHGGAAYGAALETTRFNRQAREARLMQLRALEGEAR